MSFVSRRARMGNSLLSVFLALTLVVGLCPSFAWAIEDSPAASVTDAVTEAEAKPAAPDGAEASEASADDAARPSAIEEPAADSGEAPATEPEPSPSDAEGAAAQLEVATTEDTLSVPEASELQDPDDSDEGTTLSAQASGTSVSKTADEAISWAKSQVGKSIDYDGAYGSQCVDLIKAYYAYLGVSAVRGNGKDYATNNCHGWERVKNGIPKKGDILVYTSSSNGYGHVAIYESDSSIYEQNYNNCGKVEHHTWKYNSSYEPGYWGYIRPNFKTAPSYSTISNGVYTIRASGDHGKSVGVAGASKADCANVRLEVVDQSAAQQWRFTRQSDGSYEILNVNSGKGLDVAGGSSADSANVQQYAKNSTGAQRWYLVKSGDDYMLKNKGSGKFLDIKGGGTAAGTNIQQYTGNSSTAQKFRLVDYSEFGTRTTDLPNGYYIISPSADSTRALDVYGANFASGTNIQLYSGKQNSAQVFHIVKKSDGTYRIMPSTTDGLAVEVAGASLDKSANIRLYTYNDSQAQQWILRSCGDGVYAFQNVRSGLFFDVQGGEMKDSANICQFTAHGGNNQKFKLVPWNKNLSGSRAKVQGLSSYRYTGRQIVPKPQVLWLANSFDKIRIPDSGAASGNYTYRHIYEAKAGKTYIIEVDKAIRLSGNAGYAHLRVVNNLSSSGVEVAGAQRVQWKNGTQSFQITLQKDGLVCLYSGVWGSTGGTAAEFQGVRVYEVLKEGTDYSTSYGNNVNVGTATVTVAGKGSYSGAVTRTFSITGSGGSSGGAGASASGPGGPSGGAASAAPAKASIAGAKVANVWNATYNGRAQAQKPTVTLGGKVLRQGTDYKLSYRNNVKVGTATMTITGIGSYTGTKSATFKVTTAAMSIAKAKVTGAKKRTYTGTAQTQFPKVKLGKSTLKAGRDYTITYSRNVAAGTATATVRGIGAYSGSKSFTFKIAPAKLSKAKVGVAAQRYTGKPVTPSPVVKVGGKVLRKGVDYTVTYKNNVKKGTAKLVIAGKGNYTGKKTVKFKIS